MEKKRIRAQWESYLESVLPANAGPVQVQETRRAFYAGAASLFGVIMNVLEPGQEATEKDLDTMDQIARELREHSRDVMRGVA